MANQISSSPALIDEKARWLHAIDNTRRSEPESDFRCIQMGHVAAINPTLDEIGTFGEFHTFQERSVMRFRRFVQRDQVNRELEPKGKGK